MVVIMRIDKVNQIFSYNSVQSDKGTKKAADEKQTYSADRVEVGGKPAFEQIKSSMKDNIVKSKRQQISAEKLESIKQKISENRYFIDTDDIVKSML